MNDEKLKKNMAEILFPVLKGSRISCNEENACKQCWFPCEVDRLADSLADALIAAGIGDVSELKKHRVVVEKSLIPEDGNSYVLPNRPLRITQLYSGEEVEKIVKERDEYKHRAEVAERAFDLILKREKNLRCIHSFTDCDKNCESCWEGYFSRQKQGYFEQAEKELAEEGKDD